MENASKALIIAGAILLAILIISLGLIVYNQAKDTVGSVNLSQQEIEAFNSNFTSYEGNNVSGSNVNALIQTVISSNQKAINDSTGSYITIKFPSLSGADMTIKVDTTSTPHKVKYEGGASTSGATASAKVIQGKTYTVVFGYSDSSLINNITVKANS